MFYGLQFLFQVDDDYENVIVGYKFENGIICFIHYTIPLGLQMVCVGFRVPDRVAPITPV